MLGNAADAASYEEPKERYGRRKEDLPSRGDQSIHADGVTTECGVDGSRDCIRRKVQCYRVTIIRMDRRNLAKIRYFSGFKSRRSSITASRRLEERPRNVLAKVLT